MELEFWYDPTMPETMLKLEGNWMERNDIYGFLYMVQSLPLQNWLYPAGSWPGIQAHLESLSRGGGTRLTFFGRKADYDDLKHALSGMRDLTLTFEPWNTEDICRERLSEMKNLLRKLNLKDSPFPELVEIAAGLADEASVSADAASGPVDEASEPADGVCGSTDALSGLPDDVSGFPDEEGDPWLRTIRNEEEFRLACRTGFDCCRVEEEFLDSFEKLEVLKKLTASLKRPADSIVCVFETEKKKRQFADYAAMFGDCDYRFVLRTDAGWEDSLRYKYGDPIRLRRCLHRYLEILSCLKKVFETKPFLEQTKHSIEIRYGRNLDAFTDDPDWESCRSKLDWLTRKKVYLEDYERVAETRMTENVRLKYKEMEI